MPEFTVVLLSTAALRVRRNTELVFKFGDDRHVTLRPFRTDEGFSATIPRGVYVAVHGPAPNLEHATEEFAAVGVGLLSSLSVAVNAFAGDALVLAGYECTPGQADREWYQHFRNVATGVPPTGRLCPPSVTKFIDAVGRPSEDGHRVARACGQYHQALSYWRPGYETLVLAHLFMAVDALVPAIVSKLSRARGCSKEELAVSYGVDIARPNWNYELGGRIRTESIFQGDGKFASRVRRASDGFEHGFLSFAEVRAVADAATRLRLSQLVRESIFRFVELDDETYSELSEDKYSSPLDSWEVTNRFHGQLSGLPESNALHEPWEHPPVILGSESLTAVSENDDGGLTYRPTYRGGAVGIPTGMRIDLHRQSVFGPPGAEVTPLDEPQVIVRPPASET